MIVNDVSTLKIHRLTKEQYERELNAGTLDENALYFTPDNDYYTEAEIDAKLSEKADLVHTHDDRYYTESEIDSKLAVMESEIDSKADADHVHVIDSSLSETSTNPVQNLVVTAALNSKVSTTTTINGKPLSSNITLSASDVGADASGSSAAALTSANTYTDEKIAALINGAPETLDTLKEIADAMQENESVVEALESAIGSKANSSDLASHINDTTVHITVDERTDWNAAVDHANSAHAPANAEENQNAFSNILVGTTTIAADTKTDTLAIAGSNVSITPDVVNSKVTIGITKANVTDALGYTPPSEDTNTTYTLTKDGSTIVLTGSDGVVTSVVDSDTTYSNATTSASGLMSAKDKTKLDNIAEGAQVNQDAFSNIVVGTTTISADNATDTLTLVAGDNVTIMPDSTDSKVTISAIDTTYADATTTTSGLMSAEDKTKLDSVEKGANNYTLPAAGTVLGGVKSGGDVTIAEGIISIESISDDDINSLFGVTA